MATTTTTITTKLWAEAGEWNRGEPALVVMRGEFDDGAIIDAPTVLHDVPLADADDWDTVLRDLGYRRIPGSLAQHTDYGVAFDIEPGIDGDGVDLFPVQLDTDADGLCDRLVVVGAADDGEDVVVGVAPSEDRAPYDAALREAGFEPVGDSAARRL